jgi:high-affinity nickel-transport protein
MTGSPLAILGLGFLLGLRHALDVDHLAAVSTIVSQRRSIWRSALVGVVWGIGHTTSLLVVAIAVIALHAEISPGIGQVLELGVAIMLMTLGARLLATVLRGGAIHMHVHDHAGHAHVHPHVHAPDAPGHDHGPSRHHHHRRPFLVGLVHGLAGSGALMLAVAATIPDPALAIAYVVIFGVGSIGGMALTSTLFAIPMVVTTRRFTGATRWVCGGAAIASVLVGLELAWTIGREAGFFA